MALVDIWADVRQGVRALLRVPVFTLTAVFSLAVGIGANAAMFTIVDSILLRPLRYEAPERLLSITQTHSDPRYITTPIPLPWVDAWRQQSDLVAAFGLYNAAWLTLTTDQGEQLPIAVFSISYSMFPVLGATRSAAGRLFLPEEDRSGAPLVAVISHAFWQSHYAGAHIVVGQPIRIAGRVYTIVGVTDEWFHFPDSLSADVFIPIAFSEQSRIVRTANVIARLRPGATLQAARSELASIHASLPVGGAPAGAQPAVQLLQDRIAGDLRFTLPLLSAVTLLLLFVACANVSTMMLTRAVTRTPELSLRVAVGATPARLAQLIIVENLVLTSVGLGLAFLSLDGLLNIARVYLVNTIPDLDNISIGRRMAVIATALGMFAGLVCSVLPVRHVHKTSSAGLKEFSNGVMHVRARDSVRQMIIAAQVAVALPVFITAILLLRTFWTLSDVQLGFEPRGVVTFRLPMIGGGFTGPQRLAVANEVIDRLRSLPGVKYVGCSTALPLAGNQFRFVIAIEGEPPPEPGSPSTAVDVASPGYFKALGIGISSGRDFDQGDIATGPQVAIVNEAFVKRWFAAKPPLGRRIALGGSPHDAGITVVGVIADVRDGNPRNAIESRVYRPLAQAAPQMGWHTLSVAIRTISSTARLIPAVRNEVSTVAPRSTVFDFATMDDRLSATVMSERQRAVTLSIFALITTALVGIGVYGMMAHHVERVMREFGIRIALGATGGDLTWLVAKYSMTPVLSGTAIGLVVSAISAQVLSSVLYGVSPHDPAAFAAAAGVGLGIAAGATYIPARRALRVDPVTLLKSD